jgi:hypothetical protein
MRYKVRTYRTEKGAQRFALKMAETFPKRQFCVVPSPYGFTFSVGMFDDGKFIAYAGKA